MASPSVVTDEHPLLKVSAKLAVVDDAPEGSVGADCHGLLVCEFHVVHTERSRRATQGNVSLVEAAGVDSLSCDCETRESERLVGAEDYEPLGLWDIVQDYGLVDTGARKGNAFADIEFLRPYARASGNDHGVAGLGAGHRAGHVWKTATRSVDDRCRSTGPAENEHRDKQTAVEGFSSNTHYSTPDYGTIPVIA